MQIPVISHSFHCFSVINITILICFSFLVPEYCETNIISIGKVIDFVILLHCKSVFALCRLLFCLTSLSYASPCIFSQIIKGKKRIVVNNSMQLITVSRHMHYFKGPSSLNKFGNNKLFPS